MIENPLLQEALSKLTGLEYEAIRCHVLAGDDPAANPAPASESSVPPTAASDFDTTLQQNLNASFDESKERADAIELILARNGGGMARTKLLCRGFRAADLDAAVAASGGRLVHAKDYTNSPKGRSFVWIAAKLPEARKSRENLEIVGR